MIEEFPAILIGHELPMCFMSFNTNQINSQIARMIDEFPAMSMNQN